MAELPRSLSFLILALVVCKTIMLSYTCPVLATSCRRVAAAALQEKTKTHIEPVQYGRSPRGCENHVVNNNCVPHIQYSAKTSTIHKLQQNLEQAPKTQTAPTWYAVMNIA